MSGLGRDGTAYDDAARSRLWAHRLHEDIVLTERQNFYLLAQSLLFVAEAELLAADERLAAAVLAVAGLLLTATWVYVVRRQRRIVAYLQERARQFLPEFDATYEGRPAGVSSTAVYVTVVPAVLGAVWVLFLVMALV